MPSRYKLRVQLTIQREARYSDREQWTPTPDRLEVGEDIDLGLVDFDELLSLMAGLHDAVSTVREHIDAKREDAG